MSPVQLNGCPNATALPLQTKVVVPIPATVMSPSDMAAAKESPARRLPGGFCGLFEAEPPMYGMNGRPWRSMAACIWRRPRSVTPDAESGVFRRVIVPVWAIERPEAAAMREARGVGTRTAEETESPGAPGASRSSMSSAGVNPARVEPPPARP